jgi:hypothetical protein
MVAEIAQAEANLSPEYVWELQDDPEAGSYPEETGRIFED